MAEVSAALRREATRHGFKLKANKDSEGYELTLKRSDAQHGDTKYTTYYREARDIRAFFDGWVARGQVEKL